MNHIESVADAYREACTRLKETELITNLINEHYSDELIFKDPLTQGKGRKAILDYCALVSKLADSIVLEKWETVCETNSIAIHWDVKAKVKYWPFTIKLPGMTLLRFNEAGKCIEHVEYWDILNVLFRVLPIAPRLVKLMPERLRNKLVFLS